jgi:hypothetical protein
LNRRTFLVALSAGFIRPAAASSRIPGGQVPALSRAFLESGGSLAEARVFRSEILRTAGGDETRARRIVAQRAEREFRSGDTIKLEGWLLARSEVLFFVSVPG